MQHDSITLDQHPAAWVADERVAARNAHRFARRQLRENAGIALAPAAELAAVSTIGAAARRLRQATKSPSAAIVTSIRPAVLRDSDQVCASAADRAIRSSALARRSSAILLNLGV